VRERALQSRTLTDRRSITLPLCVLAAGAVHGLAVMALLPMMITLPGPGSVRPQASQLVEVDVLPAAAAAPPSLAPRDPETTAAIPVVAVTAVPVAPEPDADSVELVPAEPGMAPAPRSDPITTVLAPEAERIPEPAPEPAASAPVADAPPEAIAAPSPPAATEAAVEDAAAPIVQEPEPPEPDAAAAQEAEAPPEAETGEENRALPQAKGPAPAVPVPTAKPAKTPEPLARAPVAVKKPVATSSKRSTAHARRTVRTRTVTTTQGGLFPNLFGSAPQAGGSANTGATTGRSTIQR
jgi:nicotinate-nucleotide--dimethylbenzimidazole phosphoribosyltransferase